jgi:NAD(P)-dependent dehydrogenase (short-subunit alcohol dehydrogenase family)
VHAVVDQTLQRFGRNDFLVNAAGKDVPGPAVSFTKRDWDYVFAVNLRAPFLFAKAVFLAMSQAGRGTIQTSTLREAVRVSQSHSGLTMHFPRALAGR